MEYYHQRFPDNPSAIKIHIAEPDSNLPEGVYAFLEIYCDNPKCDCEEVVIEVTKLLERDRNSFEVHDDVIAVLNYSWKQPVSEKNPCFHDKATQSQYATMAKEVLVDYIQTDPPTYSDELANHFYQMKQDTVPATQASAKKLPKTGRNDPCTCGSGKKYKKCCLTKTDSR